MVLKIIPLELLDNFKKLVDEDLINSLNEKPILEIPVDYFQFYTSVSSVYSSPFFQRYFINLEKWFLRAIFSLPLTCLYIQ